MTPRYASFDPRARACECCGAGLLRGAVVLSDGRKLGRQCAARAMGKPRENAAAKRLVDLMERRARQDTHQADYDAAVSLRPGWRWVGKGYAGNAGWGSTDAYLRADGSLVLEVADATTSAVVLGAAPEIVIGADWRRGAMLISVPEAWPPSLHYAGAMVWTTDRRARWERGEGWRS